MSAHWFLARLPGGAASPAPADEAVAAAIALWLGRDRIVDARFVDASVRRGKVTLTGIVATPLQRQRSYSVAAAVPGVRRVRNRLRVRAAD